MKRKFDTDGLILGYEAFVYVNQANGRYMVSTDKAPNMNLFGWNRLTDGAALVLHANRRAAVSIQRRLGHEVHDDHVQICRLKSNYYDDRWREY